MIWRAYMSQQHYQFLINYENSRIEIAMIGFWTMEIMDSYVKAKKQALDDIRVTGKSRDDITILFDISEWQLQSKEVAERLAMYDGGNDAFKTAVVTRSDTLHKMQSKRIATQDYWFFSNKAEAEKWLDE